MDMITPEDEEYYKRKILELSLLFRISENLKKSLDIKEIVQPILKIIAEHMGMLRATITLLNRITGDILIELAYGLSSDQKKRGRYKLGEGITGKVIKTGEAAVVPRISDEPLFLNRTGARLSNDKKDISFICVPIHIGSQTIGALSVDRLFDESISLDEDVRLLTIISSMIAKAVHFRQTVKEDHLKLVEENKLLHEKLKNQYIPLNIIGNSHLMKKVYALIARVAKTNTTVLLRGESGTGKELVAHAIHFNSNRALKAFIKVNCSALPETIIESELFGHERGAFTGAVSNRKGRFELANGGTLFLDEIGDLSIHTQIKLLRILQEKEYERVGGSVTFKTDVRIISATNQNLEKMIEEKTFREDLYYRLNVFPIYIPPLRDRRTDIVLLAEHFIDKYNKLHKKEIKRISSSSIDLLLYYHWPGNVRELENCIERAVLLSHSDVILAHHLPPSIQSGMASDKKGRITLDESLNNLERALLIDSLRIHKGNMHRAAAYLGITDRKIGIRIKKHNINSKVYKKKKDKSK